MKRKINIDSILYKPETIVNTYDILGENYVAIDNGPNIFVIETNESIISGENLEFNFNSLFYELNDINVIKEEDNRKWIECRKWIEAMEEYI